MRARRQSRGFTLIELFIGLLIFGLLLLLGMPSFTTYLRNSEIRSTAESLINGLRTASAEAANRNQPVSFTLTGGGASWKINAVDPDTRALQDPPIQQYESKEAGKNFTVSIQPSDQTSVTFTGLGRVLINRAAPEDHIRAIDILPTSGGEGRPLRIIVDDPTPSDPTKPRGLRMCDPDAHLKSINDPRAC